MKNICILKGWFNMEEFKNGAISEEALDEIAGGLSVSSSTVKNVLLAAGIGVLAAGSGFGGAIGMKEYMKSQKKKRTPAAPAAPQKNIPNNIVKAPDPVPQKKEPVKVERKEHPANMVEDMLYPQWW